MSSSENFPESGRSVWLRVWNSPDVQIQPLDAETVGQASRARVWVEGVIAAHLQRSERYWELRLPGRPRPIASSGSTATSAVINWLPLFEENQA